MKVILGPLPCRDCGSPVTIVRRDVAYWCSSHGRVCSFLGRDHHVVEDGGDTHVCPTLERMNGLVVDTRARARDNGSCEEALSKQRQPCYPALAAPVEVLADLPGPLRISEQ